MRRRLRLLALSLLALAAILAIASPSTTKAHGTQDQFLTGDPGCLATTMRAAAPVAAARQQEFVPSAIGTGLQSFEFCIVNPSGPVNITINIRSGTIAAPGPILETVAATGVPASALARQVHVELPLFIPTTAGAPYLMEITGFPSFSLRGTCGAIGGACTTVDPDLYPAGVSNSGPTAPVPLTDVVGDFWFRTFASTDFDGDLISDAVDNCPSNSNVDQANADGNFSDNSPPYTPAVDDLTIVNSDALGDACDPDADNDGLPTATETNLVTLQAVCTAATAVTDPLKLDTDGDRINDGAECALGSNPADGDPTHAGAKPPIPPIAIDPDRDLLSTAFEATLGTNPNLSDTDGDGVSDGVEYRGYRSNPLVIDTDLDGIRDRCEIASINGDTIVNSGDQALLATEIQRAAPPAQKLADFDLNKDTVLNSGDQALMATAIGPGKCP